LLDLGGWQMYRGTLSNGTPVTIRTLRVKRSQTSQSFNRHIEMISKLRHRHLVSALGHCFEYNLDDSTVTQLYLVFEYVQNGNLRSRISRECLSPSLLPSSSSPRRGVCSSLVGQSDHVTDQ
jgi:serine/threonine protein kinase